MVTFVKGYANNSESTTKDTVGATKNLGFASNYVELTSGKAAANPNIKVYENTTNPTVNAREFMGITAKAIPSLSMELPIGDISSTRVSKKGVTSRIIKLTTEGWNYVKDDANSDFDAYQPGFSITTKIAWNEDDFVDASLLQEALDRHISGFVRNDGATSRLPELMRGSILNLD